MILLLFSDENNGMASLSAVHQTNSVSDDKIYSTLSSTVTVKSNNNRMGATVAVTATTVRSAGLTTAAPNKSPRKHQKHRIDSCTVAGGSGNSSSTSGNTAAVNKRDHWPLTSTKQNDRAEFSSNEDLATCSKGTF